MGEGDVAKDLAPLGRIRGQCHEASQGLGIEGRYARDGGSARARQRQGIGRERHRRCHRGAGLVLAVMAAAARAGEGASALGRTEARKSETEHQQIWGLALEPLGMGTRGVIWVPTQIWMLE
jgi:hypothetical protein